MASRTIEYRVGTEDGSYRFRRRWAAERAFELITLDAETPVLILSRVDPDGTLTILAERHFEAKSGIKGSG